MNKVVLLWKQFLLLEASPQGKIGNVTSIKFVLAHNSSAKKSL